MASSQSLSARRDSLGHDPLTAALAKAGGNLSAFNPEQQAMIIQHYYVRRYVENMPAAAWQPWLTYAEHVYTA